MIGVLSRPDQTGALEEFFELFKTPWEAYAPGRAYDVVVATVDEVPEVDAPLLISYGARPKASDLRDGIAPHSSQQGAYVDFNGVHLPIYGALATFAAEAGAAPAVVSSAGIAGVRIERPGGATIRVGFDLFDEAQRLLSAGQPAEHAHVPALDLHIAMLRRWIVDVGIPLLEVTAAPAGHRFFVCLTHDIDFVGIRRHFLDHTMWGFLYRSTFGTIRNLVRGRLSAAKVLNAWRAVAALPFVYLGWAKDFWDPFAWYLHVERDLPATYYLIPFKRRAGDHVAGRGGARRATAYDVGDPDLKPWIDTLLANGCEIGVHGIDAWHSVDRGRDELGRISAVTKQARSGVRMHWLLGDAGTPAVLERAGYAYDATNGYNETVGYRAGTTQVFRPFGAQALLELPLHIQDGALFYPQRLDLSKAEAEARCRLLIDHATRHGGVLTVLWHDRSHGPERFWGDFYVRLVDALKSAGAIFATADQTITWFRGRREIRFESVEQAGGTRIRLRSAGGSMHPPLRVVVHNAGAAGDAGVAWNGDTPVTFDVSRPSVLAFRRGSKRPAAPARLTAAG